MTQSSCKRDTKSKSHPSVKLAPVRVFSFKHPLSDDPQGRQMIFKCLAAHSRYSLPVEALNMIVELSKSLPDEVNNSTIELHLPVDSQYSLSVEAVNLIVTSKSIKSFVMESIFFFSAFSSNFFLSFRQKCFHSE